MTEPPEKPPPYSAPDAPPYPTGYPPTYPTYLPGSAPVGQPVTAVPAYPETGWRRHGPATLGVVLTVITALLCGLGGLVGFLAYRTTSDDSQDAAPPPAQTRAAPSPSPTHAGVRHTVVYEVTGATGSAIVTYTAADGPEPGHVDLPWREEVTVTGDTFVAMVFALQIQGGDLTCRILVDGREISKKTSDNGVYCSHMIVD